jgi:hypothetical protein
MRVSAARVSALRASGSLPTVVLVCTVLCLSFCLCPPSLAATPSDQAAAERVLGRQWKHLARRAGMIFAGTVLSTDAETAKRRDSRTEADREPKPALTDAASPTSGGGQQPATLNRGVPAVELRFRIDGPIAGVQLGQVLTIHEWIGASSRQPTLRAGERVLIFLYPPSRLGLTSPVDGPQGQIRLDSSGQNVPRPPAPALLPSHGAQSKNSPSAFHATAATLVPISQLERAIRGARGE